MDKQIWAKTLDLAGGKAALYPDREVVKDISTGVDYTYGDLDKQASALANYFTGELKLEKGSRVALLSRNSVECLVAFFAVQKTGLILVPLNWRLSARELLEHLGQTEPEVLLYDAAFASQVQELETEYELRRLIYHLEQNASGESLPGVSFSSLIKKGSSEFNSYPPLNLEDPLMILFTGGTTGPPKGAVLSHRTIFFNMLAEAQCWRLGPGQVIPVLLPFFHTGGWNLLTLPSLFAGAKILIFRGFDPAETLKQVEQEHCRTIFAAPTMFQVLSSHEDFVKRDLSSLEWVMSGAAPCPKQVMEPYWERSIPFVQGYGITEGGPNNLFVPWYELSWDRIRDKWPSVGRPFLYCFARLVDGEGNPVEGQREGELLLGGPVTFSGYWNRPGETSDTLKDGWVHTGDIARRDEEGFFYIVDRKKDMFISGGENVFPVEIETALTEHPAIKDAAVIGVPHPKWGEVGKAFVVAKEGREVSVDELAGFLRDRLANYKVPGYFEFVDQIPKSSVGKILKTRLKEQ